MSTSRDGSLKRVKEKLAKADKHVLERTNWPAMLESDRGEASSEYRQSFLEHGSEREVHGLALRSRFASDSCKYGKLLRPFR